jgi:hypothetical protein
LLLWAVLVIQVNRVSSILGNLRQPLETIFPEYRH